MKTYRTITQVRLADDMAELERRISRLTSYCANPLTSTVHPIMQERLGVLIQLRKDLAARLAR